jgi:hypothetical protein
MKVETNHMWMTHFFFKHLPLIQISFSKPFQGGSEPCKINQLLLTKVEIMLESHTCTMSLCDFSDGREAEI